MAGDLNLSNIQPAQKRVDRKRVGRGMGSGKGRYSGRGIKGQKSRAGSHAMRAGFEGGQMPLAMRTAKLRGNTSRDAMPIGPFRTYTQPVNVRDLDRFEDGDEVNSETLKAKGLIRSVRKDVKLLGVGELTKKLSITVHGASATAREKVEAAGGTLTLLREPKVRKPKNAKRRPETRPQTSGTGAADDDAAEAAAETAAAEVAQKTQPSRRRKARPRLHAVLGLERLARPRPAQAAALHGRNARRVPPRLVDARAGRRLEDDRELLQRPGRRVRPAQPVLRLGALALLGLRARDHAVRHGVDHPAADDGGHPLARAVAEGGRGRYRQDQPVHALPDHRARARAGVGLHLSLPSPGRPAG